MAAVWTAEALADHVLRELDAFRAPSPHPGQLGVPLSAEWFEAGAQEMRRALVTPYPLAVLDYHRRPDAAVERTVWIVADDGDFNLLGFDPRPDGDFALVWRLEDGPALSNIRGDAVNCFLAR